MKCFNDVREIFNTFRDDLAIFKYQVSSKMVSFAWHVQEETLQIVQVLTSL